MYYWFRGRPSNPLPEHPFSQIGYRCQRADLPTNSAPPGQLPTSTLCRKPCLLLARDSILLCSIRQNRQNLAHNQLPLRLKRKPLQAPDLLLPGRPSLCRLEFLVLKLHQNLEVGMDWTPYKDLFDFEKEIRIITSATPPSHRETGFQTSGNETGSSPSDGKTSSTEGGTRKDQLSLWCMEFQASNS
ncbi:hypothetical protein L211DRAFT_848064 [Terfezia boudieri ATCC MYA-4762]|uniref:Uncharacterized protein n=1 Tax=Terfezia boudieri ATCC MYA-4762 TaxID=1051890 RepID=A0A3N4LQJ5_9PEZI|nr:hypothetical protein L211DRAFT_848064 [Terfezia boudieri ATCC MYA-4762]